MDESRNRIYEEVLPDGAWRVYDIDTIRKDVNKEVSCR